MRKVRVLQVLAYVGLCLPLLPLGLSMACHGTCPEAGGRAGLEDLPGARCAGSSSVGLCEGVPSPLSESDGTCCACSADTCTQSPVSAGSIVSVASQRLTVSGCFLRAWSAGLCAPVLAPSRGLSIECSHPTPGLSHLRTVILLV